MDFDPSTNMLWVTENGPSFGDEVNLVEAGFNCGWKKIQGIWKLKGATYGNVTLDPEGLVGFQERGKYFKAFSLKQISTSFSFLVITSNIAIKSCDRLEIDAGSVGFGPTTF
jgi:hypothetical protein